MGWASRSTPIPCSRTPFARGMGAAWRITSKRLGDLFAPFTKVAARNPEAWFPVERSAGGADHRHRHRTE